MKELGGTESGRNRKESSREEAEQVRAYDEKRRPLIRKKVMEMEVQVRRKR